MSGFWGAVVAAAGTFVPCYFFTIRRRRHRSCHRGDHGAIIVIGQRSTTDLATASLALVTVGVLWRFKKLPEPLIVLAAALAGLVLYPLMRRG